MSKPIHLIGNAHLDPIWLWRWQEGCNEALQTFRSALDRIKEYPDFVFTCSSAAYYRWVEEIDPAMFAEVKEAIAAGRWEPVNGWWVQPDCNMPSAESFARHALYSQGYYKEKFGVTCKTGYNVDSFGHNWNLPQLLKQGGMEGYCFQRPGGHENAEIPYGAFWWEGADGSRVTAWHILGGYGCGDAPGLSRKIEEHAAEAEKRGMPVQLYYGIGNHGGGPTRGLIETALQKKAEGYNLVFSAPDRYFRDLLEEGVDLPVWADELQHHASGCYAATSLIKEHNRRCEEALFFAEVFDTAAALQFGAKAHTSELKEAWLNVCFNHFHDIFDGCSIREAYTDVRDMDGYAMTVADHAANTAMLKIARSIDTWLEGVSDPVFEERYCSIDVKYPRPLVVFNACGFAREVPVRTTFACRKVEDSQGNAVPCQNVVASRFTGTDEKDTLFIAKLPAMGYAVYWMWPRTREVPIPEPLGTAKAYETDGIVTLENEYLRAAIAPTDGSITLTDLVSGKTYADICAPTVINDIAPDIWAHDYFVWDDTLGKMEVESVRITEDGSARAVAEVKHSYGKSWLLQRIILATGQKNLVSECKAIWQEPWTMLKMNMPLRGENPTATYEIPGAFIKRPCNGEEEPAMQWADLTVGPAGSRAGLSLMSDSKYSYACPATEDGAMLGLTVIRNSVYADHCAKRPEREYDFCDEGLQRFTYAVYPHTGEAEESEVSRLAHSLNNAPFVVQESYHKGTLPKVNSYGSVDCDNILITAYKLAEDGSGDIILRLFETQGKAHTTAAIALPQIDAAFYADFAKFEIKTFRVTADGKATQVNFLE
ncbi:MAG: hypothetical protein LBR73_02105 [Oscillospiraceae bacterium]|jgi:alpha-mannosidase|nr:hypothetical protein [Oscillospiraceae bacterium]